MESQYRWTMIDKYLSWTIKARKDAAIAESKGEDPKLHLLLADRAFQKAELLLK